MDQDDARARLAELGAEHQRVRTEYEAVRRDLRPIVEAALRAGVIQAEVVRLSGYTRENVRQIARSAGITAERSQ